MSVDVRPLRELAAARKKSEGPERTLAMRDAGEALAERLRAEPGVDGLETLDLGTMVFESSQVLAGWRAPTSLAVLRRRGWLLRAGGVRALVDPRTDEPVTPYEERLAQRHPLRGRAAGGVPLRAAIEKVGSAPDEIGLVLLTHLRFVSIPALLTALPRARIVVSEREWSRATAAGAWERPYLDRTPLARHERIVLAPGDAILEGNIGFVATPGLTEGTSSVVVSVGRRVRVFSANGLTKSAWTPYESPLSGLREAVRLRDVEVVPRGDAESPRLSVDSMVLERSIADRDGAFHAIDSWAELLPTTAFLRR